MLNVGYLALCIMMGNNSLDNLRRKYSVLRQVYLKLWHTYSQFILPSVFNY
jgi:hypothetical protein